MPGRVDARRRNVPGTLEVEKHETELLRLLASPYIKAELLGLN